MTEPVEKAVKNMCDLSEYVWERGVRRGEEIGKEKGSVGMLFNLVKKRILSVKEAAPEAGMTEADFISGMNKYFAVAGKQRSMLGIARQGRLSRFCGQAGATALCCTVRQKTKAGLMAVADE